MQAFANSRGVRAAEKLVREMDAGLDHVLQWFEAYAEALSTRYFEVQPLLAILAPLIPNAVRRAGKPTAMCACSQRCMMGSAVRSKGRGAHTVVLCLF